MKVVKSSSKKNKQVGIIIRSKKILDIEVSKEIIAILIFILPFLIIGGYIKRQKLIEYDWQERSNNETQYEQVLDCLNPLEKVDKAITKAQAHFFLKQGNSCLKSLPYFSGIGFDNANIFWLEKELNENNNLDLDKSIPTKKV